MVGFCSFFCVFFFCFLATSTFFLFLGGWVGWGRGGGVHAFSLVRFPNLSHIKSFHLIFDTVDNNVIFPFILLLSHH